VTRADTVIGAGLAIAFFLFLVASTGLKYQSEFAPGPGFAPFWLGIVGTVLSATIAIRGLRAAPAPAFERRGVLRVAAAIVGLVVAAALAERLGFIVAMALYLAVVTLFIERMRPITALVTTSGIIVLIYVVFVRLLAVPFPQGPLGF